MCLDFFYLLNDKEMDLRIVSFFSAEPPSFARDVAHASDGLRGISVLTYLTIHDEDRKCPADYDTKIAFSHQPKSGRVYKLGDLPVYIDDKYTSLYFSCPYDLFIIFRKDLTNNAWNLVKHLAPLPEVVYNPQVSPERTVVGDVTYVSTAFKPAVFDRNDILVE